MVDETEYTFDDYTNISAGGGGMKPTAKDGFAISGELTLRVHRKDGSVEEEKLQNLIVNGAFNYLPQLLVGNTNARINTMAVGTGGWDHELGVPKLVMPSDGSLFEHYQSGVMNYYGGTPPEGVVEGIQWRTEPQRNTPGHPEYSPFIGIATYAYTFDCRTDTAHINESALFVSDGTMFSKRTFPARVLSLGDFLEIVWEIGVTRF